MKKTLAIVGATGVVGRTVLKVLEEKNLPIDEYILFASAKSAGQKINFMHKEYSVLELNEHSFDNHIDYAIFSAGSETAKHFAPIASSHRTIVIDNSNAFRMDENVPLVVPEVNPEEIKKHNGIIANPNCSTIQAVVALKPLDDKYKIKRIVYSTYQAVSGAGRDGIDDLKSGIIDFYINNFSGFGKHTVGNYNIVESSDYPLKKFDYPIFNNCLPQIDVFLDNNYTKEEMKMVNETRKILGKKDLPVTATAVRVPIFNSHCESINVEFENAFDIDDLISSLHSFESLTVVQKDSNNKNIYPISTKVSGNDGVFVGRIRRDFSVKSGVNLWVVADNIRKGAASNAVQILEKLVN